ncbi:MAG TPA: tRNA uridine-5-carboxymethylaminomethyl(34) synthesis GTPase MnmE [Candidatus Anaerotruncus excrementipullorum]|uniref:tRNA modification GTPase MnmE n=1 Tax=Candidatus Anaerotruncus excrementipullorum TaxID=2838465 RepID=A0A9D1WSQ5_9FIRM|nr:tRNA uridine-5-carboxymethylaminomethyl(34) synthesis GTPase MnmE [Candidatus Anaerotruncus excrementipullorum]
MDLQTIAAISTPLGVGGLGVVRLSGPQALEVAGRVARLADGRPVTQLPGYTCAFGHVFDQQGEIDEVVVTVFRAPKSSTGEPVAELSIHGGPYLLERLLRACYAAGARPAQPGEFTKRAFLHGKLDLTRAEAVADLIAAQGRQAAQAALAAKEGALYRRARQVTGQLLELAAHLAAWIDYPEEDLPQVEPQALEGSLAQAAGALEQLLATYDTGRVIREGVETAIVGRPNAGKSTLMNLLAGAPRSIVTQQAGTTRDVVTETVRLGEVVLRLADTAGIRESGDLVEQMGVALAEERLRQAQLVLAVFDGSQPLSEDDRRVIEACQGCCCIGLVNKNDLPQQVELEQLREKFPRLLVLSAQEPESRELLAREIGEVFRLEGFDPGAAVVANERQYAAVAQALGETREALAAARAGVSYDAVCVCIQGAADALLELTGEKASQAVVDQVFSRFCVGK